MTASCAAVPVAPETSVVEGTVCGYSILSSFLIGIQPEQVLHRITLCVESAGDGGEKGDRIVGRAGKYLPLYSKERLSPRLFGRKVRVRVIYRGDERGGLFWIEDLEIR